MANVIEEAKSARASCRACREKIDKGALRFGAEVPSTFGEGMQLQWYHLSCAAKKLPHEVREALASFAGEVPARDEIEALIQEAAQKVKPKPAALPYAERASTGRSHCQVCREAIDKGALRIAVEREVGGVGFQRAGAAYLHVACAREYAEPVDVDAVVANSRGLADAELAEVRRALG